MSDPKSRGSAGLADAAFGVQSGDARIGGRDPSAVGAGGAPPLGEPALPASSASSAFGAQRRADWGLDPEITYLNHGTVGAPPLRVLAAQRAIRDAIERQPSRYLLRELAEVRAASLLPPMLRLRSAANEVAAFLGARGEDLAFVDNATAGANAVLATVPLQPGDEWLLTDHGYGGVSNAARYHARVRRADVRTAVLPNPIRSPAEVTAAIESALGPTTRLLVVDHIASDSALILPVAEIAARCRARGVAVLVDGAHAPGGIALDIQSLGVDWYVGNLHKWAWTPRSSGILWAAPERQADLHPPVISWGLDSGFTAEFDWAGTRDPSPHLAAPAAIALLRELGFERIAAYNHDLVWRGAQLLADRWGTRLEHPESMFGTMATIYLPAASGSTAEEAAGLRDALLYEDRIEVHLHARNGRLRVRVAAQIYNELADFERLAAAVLARLPKG